MNPRALRDFHDTRTSSTLDPAAFDADDNAADHIAAPINAADLIARFRESGLVSEVGRRSARPVGTGTVNASAPLPLLKKPMLDRAVSPKPAAPKPAATTLTASARRTDPANGWPKSVPSETLSMADLLNRHPDIASQSPRTGHRVGTPRPTRARGRTLAVLRPSVQRPSPSIRVVARPVLTVAAIVAAFALVEAPNLLTHSHAASDSRATSAHTSAVAETASGATVDTITTAADLPRHGGGTITPGTSASTSEPTTGTSSGRVSRSARRAIGAAANHVPLLKPGQTVPGTWIRPSSGRYTSCFCSRWGSFHAGIDLASKLGTPILAVGDGTVIKAGPASGFGNWVVIQHSNGDVSIYGHMKYFFVHAGQKVKAGEKIAVVGDQGFSTGPHLHFEIHKGGLGGTKINPIPWLKARGIVIGPLSKDG